MKSSVPVNAYELQIFTTANIKAHKTNISAMGAGLAKESFHKCAANGKGNTISATFIANNSLPVSKTFG
jgi:hypothetical protein